MESYGFNSSLAQPSHLLYHESTPETSYMHHHSSGHFNSDTRASNGYVRGYEQGYLPHHYDTETNEILERIESGSVQHQYSPYAYSPCGSWQAFNNGYNMNNYSTNIQRNSKQKRARMSLQKRLLVNARERERMRVLNKAFEALRDVLPCYIADGHMAKITTLRLAINYIKALTDLLNEQKVIDGTPDRNLRLNVDITREELFNSILKDTKLNSIPIKNSEKTCNMNSCSKK